MSLFTQLPELHRIKCIFRKYGFQPLAHRPCSRGMGQWEQWSFFQRSDWPAARGTFVRIPPSCVCAPGLPGPHWVFLLTFLMACVPSVFTVSPDVLQHFLGESQRKKGSTTSTSRLGTQADLSVLPTLAWFQLTLQVTTEVIYRNYIIVLFGDRKFSQAL